MLILFISSFPGVPQLSTAAANGSAVGPGSPLLSGVSQDSTFLPTTTTPASPSPLPANGAFYLHNAAGQYAYLVQSTTSNTAYPYYVVAFTVSKAQASRFELDSSGHLVSGDYIAEIGNDAVNTPIRFAQARYIDQNDQVPLVCHQTQIGTVICQDQSSSVFYVCDDYLLSIGATIPDQCQAVTLDPSTTSTSSSGIVSQTGTSLIASGVSSQSATPITGGASFTPTAPVSGSGSVGGVSPITGGASSYTSTAPISGSGSVGGVSSETQNSSTGSGSIAAPTTSAAISSNSEVGEFTASASASISLPTSGAGSSSVGESASGTSPMASASSAGASSPPTAGAFVSSETSIAGSSASKSLARSARTATSIPCGSTQVFSLQATSSEKTVDGASVFVEGGVQAMSLHGHSAPTTTSFSLDSSCRLVANDGNATGAVASQGKFNTNAVGGIFIYFIQPSDLAASSAVAATCNVAGGLLLCLDNGGTDFSISSGAFGGYVLLGVSYGRSLDGSKLT